MRHIRLNSKKMIELLALYIDLTRKNTSVKIRTFFNGLNILTNKNSWYVSPHFFFSSDRWFIFLLFLFDRSITLFCFFFSLPLSIVKFNDILVLFKHHCCKCCDYTVSPYLLRYSNNYIYTRLIYARLNIGFF